MLKISFIIFLLSYSIFSIEIGETCIYRFDSQGKVYPGSLKMEVISVTKDNFTILVTQKVGTISKIKKIKISKNISVENYAEEMLKVTFAYNNKKYKILKKYIRDNYTYNYYNSSYPASRVDIDLLFGGKKYKIVYVFSKLIPVTHLIIFSVRQEIEKGNKRYSVKNRVLLQDYGKKGKLKKI